MTSKKQNPEGPFVFGLGTNYADKEELIAKGLSFDILSIEFQAGKGFEGADRWACEIQVNDGREGTELLTFAPNEKRDEEMLAAQAHITSIKGPITGITLKKYGRAYYFVSPK
jgi:hypothetical protein